MVLEQTAEQIRETENSPSVLDTALARLLPQAPLTEPTNSQMVGNPEL
jgi:hypothetical protein